MEDISFLDEVARHLLNEGIVASDEVIEQGIEKYNMEIGESSSKDIAINIKNELLKEEEKSKITLSTSRSIVSIKRISVPSRLINTLSIGSCTNPSGGTIKMQVPAPRALLSGGIYRRFDNDFGRCVVVKTNSRPPFNT